MIHEDVSKKIAHIRLFYNSPSWSIFSEIAEQSPSADHEVNAKLLNSSDKIESVLKELDEKLVSLDQSEIQSKVSELLLSLKEEIRAYRIAYLMSRGGQSDENSASFLKMENQNLLHEELIDSIVDVLKDRLSKNN